MIFVVKKSASFAAKGDSASIKPAEEPDLYFVAISSFADTPAENPILNMPKI